MSHTKKLIDIIDTSNSPNIIEEIMRKEHARLKQIDTDEWLYYGCFIQKSVHPKLVGKYEVFKNDEPQTHIGRCHTFAEAKKLCTYPVKYSKRK